MAVFLTFLLKNIDKVAFWNIICDIELSELKKYFRKKGSQQR